MDDPKNVPNIAPDSSDNGLCVCTCGQDPFASLPPELRPTTKPSMGSLRKVACPGCGLVYWTNRAVDLCVDCEKKGMQLPRTDSAQEE